MPASSERHPVPMPKQSHPLPFADTNSLKWVRSFPPTESEMFRRSCSGCCLVFTITKPPVKSAGYSGAGLFTMTMLSSCELGRMSKEKARVSASELGTALPLSHTLLYRPDNPRTITNLPSMTETPGMRRITSPASLSCVRAICWAETPVCTTRLCFWACTCDASVSWRATAVTFTSPMARVSSVRAKSAFTEPCFPTFMPAISSG